MLAHLLDLLHRSTLEGFGASHKGSQRNDSSRERHKRCFGGVRSTSRAWLLGLRLGRLPRKGAGGSVTPDFERIQKLWK